MFIEVVDVTEENKGKYSQLNVTFRKDGKIAEKKLMSFGGSAPSYNVIRSADKGETFNVTAKQNDKGFWDWIEAVKATEPAVQQAAKAAGATPAPRNTYETPEERANRQILIVRQSSISSAVDLLAARKKEASPEEVVDVASIFEDYVFNGKAKNGFEMVAEMQDDIPF